jgi:hypothetical protein
MSDLSLTPIRGVEDPHAVCQHILGISPAIAGTTPTNALCPLPLLWQVHGAHGGLATAHHDDIFAAVCTTYLAMLMCTQCFAAVNGDSTYMSIEHVTRAKQHLGTLHSRMFDAGIMAEQFSHNICLHSPEGVTTCVGPTRCLMDEKCNLVMDLVPWVSKEQLRNMRYALRQPSLYTLAYDMVQITRHCPCAITSHTIVPIHSTPMRN